MKHAQELSEQIVQQLSDDALEMTWQSVKDETDGPDARFKETVRRELHARWISTLP